MCGLAAPTGCRSVRVFGARVRFAQDRSVPGQSCFVVVRGFEDLLELVQVLLHAVFEQLGCDPAEIGGWSWETGAGDAGVQGECRVFLARFDAVAVAEWSRARAAF